MKDLSRRKSPWFLLGALAFSLPLSSSFAAEDESSFILGHVLGSKIRNNLEHGHQLYKNRDFVGAVNAYYKAAQDDPKDALAWYSLGLAYLKVNHYNYAAQVLQTAVNISPREEFQYHLALALFEGGDVRLAIKSLRGIVAEHAKNDMAWTLLGRSYECLGQFAQAKSCYIKALEVAPHQGQALFLLERLDPKLAEGDLQLQGKNAAVSTEAMAVASAEDFSGPIPPSRVISRIKSDDRPMKTSELIPLLQCYHISEDAPEKGLVATKTIDWEQPKEAPASEMPAITPAPIEVPVITPPSILTEDL
jgi:tetratricopeptide (TPR) repeat protein